MPSSYIYVWLELSQQQLKQQRQTPQHVLWSRWVEWRTFYSRPHGLQRLNDIIFIFTWKTRCNWDLLAEIRLTIFFISTHFENKIFFRFLRILSIFFRLFTVEKKFKSAKSVQKRIEVYRKHLIGISQAKQKKTACRCLILLSISLPLLLTQSAGFSVQWKF